jgi:hypothetical protein
LVAFMRAAVLSVALTACAYSPGSFRHFRHDFPGQRTTVGCLDLAVERRADLTTGGTVIAYEFGNRCDHPAVVDLAAVDVVGRTFAGDEVKLAPFDPERELRALAIGMSIAVGVIDDGGGQGVDTEADLARAEALLGARAP